MTNNGRRVFLPENTQRFPLDDAAKYGTVVPLLNERERNPLEATEYIQAVVDVLVSHDYDPDADLLCLTGSTLAVALLLSGALVRWHKVQVLMFDAREGSYRRRTIFVEEKRKGESHELGRQ